MVEIPPKPQYFHAPAPDTSMLPGVNGARASETSTAVKIHSIADAIPQEEPEHLVAWITEACTEAAKVVVSENIAAINEKISILQIHIVDFKLGCESLAKQAVEIAQSRSDLEKLGAQLAIREASLSVTMANQSVATRILVMIALVTGCLIWAFTIYSPEWTRVAAATIFSAVTLGPLVALLWLKS